MVMSPRGRERKIGNVPKFDGNTERFPIFCIKFEALIYRLGSKYSKALQNKAPYIGLKYGTTHIQLTPPEEPKPSEASAKQDDSIVTDPLEAKEEQKTPLTSGLLTGATPNITQTPELAPTNLFTPPKQQTRREHQDRTLTHQGQSYEKIVKLQADYDEICEVIYRYIIGYLGNDRTHQEDQE